MTENARTRKCSTQSQLKTESNSRNPWEMASFLRANEAYNIKNNDSLQYIECLDDSEKATKKIASKFAISKHTNLSVGIWTFVDLFAWLLLVFILEKIEN